MMKFVDGRRVCILSDCAVHAGARQEEQQFVYLIFLIFPLI